ncbi:XkdX family protein [Lactobacillus intestinalis]|uniref:XkdX family protein n=1 Tax=Lactobacillus intestinalis TaxID=151781 RepID=UPI0025A99B92|nr:XkdX family protein [Lactobacillus intestinalis]
MINFTFTPIDMVPIYKQEFDLGWINKQTVASYIDMGIIDANGYERIVGEAYVAPTNSQPIQK